MHAPIACAMSSALRKRCRTFASTFPFLVWNSSHALCSRAAGLADFYVP